MRRSREGGNPVPFGDKPLGPRLRGDDGVTLFNCRINIDPRFVRAAHGTIKDMLGLACAVRHEGLAALAPGSAARPAKGAICAGVALLAPTTHQYQAIICACTQARSLQTPMQQHSAASTRRFSPTRFIRRGCVRCPWPAPLRGG
jgi:hypothetical protein